MKSDVIQQAIQSLESAYRYRADSEVGYLLSDSDIIGGIAGIDQGMSYAEAQAIFDVIYPNIKANHGMYQSVEDGIAIQLGIITLQEVFRTKVPTQKELYNTAKSYAEQNEIRNVKMFIRHCECNITFSMEEGIDLRGIELL